MRTNTTDPFGFSLLEALIGIGLFTLLASISIPAASKLLASRQLHQERERLVQTLEQAHLISTNREERLVLYIQTHKYELRQESDHALLSQHYFSDNITIDHPPLPYYIYFYPRGTTSPASIIIRNLDTTCSITLSLRGRVGSTCA